MFFWPHLELTEYEKRFVAAYSTPAVPASGRNPAIPGKPGVLRRMYKVLLNNTEHPGVTGLEDIHLTGGVQISRASRVFALTFSGDVHAWRMKMFLASGTEFTPKLQGGTYPMVSTLSPGASWNIASTDMAGPDNLTINAVPTRQIAWQQMPMLIEPNWELDQNETLMFDGEAQSETALVLEIGVHVWEFPGMTRGLEGPEKEQAPQMSGGPVIVGSRC